MTIEVRQMLIKSSVLQKAEEERAGDQSSPSLEAIKEDILTECRQLVVDLLRDRQER